MTLLLTRAVERFFVEPLAAITPLPTLRAMTRFEARRRRIRVHRRDRVGYMAGPKLEARLEALETEFTNVVVNGDPSAADFFEWYADEATKYGPPVRRGLAALYWYWTKRAGGPLTHATYGTFRDELAKGLRLVIVDGEHPDNALDGRGQLQEFVWWSASDWILADYLVEAIDEFMEYRDAGKLPEWRRRKRRRLAAHRRKMIKILHASPPEGLRLRFLKPKDDGATAPSAPLPSAAPAKGKARR